MTVRITISTLSPRLAAHWKRALPGAEIRTEPLEVMFQRQDCDMFYIPISIAERLGGEPSTKSHQYFFHPHSGRLMVTPRIVDKRPEIGGADADEYVLITTILEILEDLGAGRGVTCIAIHEELLGYDRSCKTKFFEHLACRFNAWLSEHPRCLKS